MSAPLYALEMYRADTHRERFRVQNENGAIIENITGWAKFWFTVKRKTTDADPGVFQLTSGSGIALIDAPNGLLEVTVAPANLADSSLLGYTTRLVFDLQGKDAAGNIWTLAAGTFLVKADSTRAVV